MSETTALQEDGRGQDEEEKESKPQLNKKDFLGDLAKHWMKYRTSETSRIWRRALFAVAGIAMLLAWIGASVSVFGDQSLFSKECRSELARYSLYIDIFGIACLFVSFLLCVFEEISLDRPPCGMGREQLETFLEKNIDCEKTVSSDDIKSLLKLEKSLDASTRRIAKPVVSAVSIEVASLPILMVKDQLGFSDVFLILVVLLLLPLAVVAGISLEFIFLNRERHIEIMLRDIEWIESCSQLCAKDVHDEANEGGQFKKDELIKCDNQKLDIPEMVSDDSTNRSRKLSNKPGETFCKNATRSTNMATMVMLIGVVYLFWRKK